MASMPASLNIAKYRFRVQMSNCRVRSIHSGDLTVAGPRYGDGEISSKCHVGNGQGDTTSKIIPLLGFECRESCSERGTLLTGVAALPSPPFGKLARTFSAFVPCGGPSNFLTSSHGLAGATVNASQSTPHADNGLTRSIVPEEACYSGDKYRAEQPSGDDLQPKVVA